MGFELASSWAGPLEQIGGQGGGARPGSVGRRHLCPGWTRPRLDMTPSVSDFFSIPKASVGQFPLGW